LTLLSHTLDWSLFGADAFGHHLVNLLLHIGSAIFLFLFLNRTTKSLWSSAFVVAIFALHPLRVESVAWASERKDVLGLFFAMAAGYAYALYAENHKISRYLLCLTLFALDLMAKPMLVTLPFLLLLLDFWPLRRWQSTQIEMPLPELPRKDKEGGFSEPAKISGYPLTRLLYEKIPFFLLAIISCVITLWAQNKGEMIASWDRLPFDVRFQNAVISYVVYLKKMFWPVDLAVFYPHLYSFPVWQVLASCGILLCISMAVIYAVRKLPFLFVGWFWYLGTLIPVIGLVQVSTLARADRYTYLPSIGIAIMLTWGVPLLLRNATIRKKVLWPVGIGFLSVMALLTWQQCSYWKNNVSLFGHALRVTKNNYLAHNIMGIVYDASGRYRSAIVQYNEAVRLRPDYADAYNNRGNAYMKIGLYQQALEDFNTAIRLHPNSAKVYYNRGSLIFNHLGRYQQAIDDFKRAIRLNPDLVMAYEGIGAAYCKLGRHQSAIEHLDQAIRLKPRNAFAYGLRGAAYLMQGHQELSCRDVQKACALGDCQWLQWTGNYGFCR